MLNFQRNVNSNLAGNDLTVGLAAKSENTIIIDNFQIIKSETCGVVSNLTVNYLNSTSASFSWDYEGEADVFDLEIVEEGEEFTGIPEAIYNNITTPLTVEGLNQDVNYQVRVRADCSEDNTTAVSFWTSSFVTPCNLSLPYLEDFSTFVPNCWSKAQGGNLTIGPSNSGVGSFFPAETSNFEFIPETFRLVLTPDNSWLISPTFNIEEVSTIDVSFDLTLTEADNLEEGSFRVGEDLYFVVSTDNLETFTIIDQWNDDNTINNESGTFSYSLTSFTGQDIQFAFFFDGTVSSSSGGRIFGDNFSVNATVAPLAISLEGNDVTCPDGQNGAAFVNVNSGIAPYTFMWSTGETSATISNLPTGEYICTVTDAINQETIESIIINTPEEISDNPIVSPTSSINATDGSIEVVPEGGTPPYTYNWSNGAQTSGIFDLPVGEYCVIVVDANECSEQFCYTFTASTAIHNIEEINKFTIFPNPVQDYFTVDLEFIEQKEFQVSMLDIFGRNLMQSSTYKAEKLDLKVPTNELPNGIYYVKIVLLESQTSITKKILKVE